jgi:hypothetical protein
LARRQTKRIYAAFLAMGVHQEAFQLLALYHHVSGVAHDHVCALKRYQMFGYTRPRSANQFGKVLVPRRNCQPHAATIGSPKIVTQFEQCERQALWKSTAHEVRATQVQPNPTAQHNWLLAA